MEAASKRLGLRPPTTTGWCWKSASVTPAKQAKPSEATTEPGFRQSLALSSMALRVKPGTGIIWGKWVSPLHRLTLPRRTAPCFRSRDLACHRAVRRPSRHRPLGPHRPACIVRRGLGLPQIIPGVVRLFEDLFPRCRFSQCNETIGIFTNACKYPLAACHGYPTETVTDKWTQELHTMIYWTLRGKKIDPRALRRGIAFSPWLPDLRV